MSVSETEPYPIEFTMPPNPGCGSCGKDAKKLCSKCKQVEYCSKECQALAWSTHKSTCKDLHFTAIIQRDYPHLEKQYLSSVTTEQKKRGLYPKGAINGCIGTTYLMPILLRVPAATKIHFQMADFQNGKVKSDDISLFVNSILNYPNVRKAKRLPLSNIYVCAVGFYMMTSNTDKPIGVGHHFCITQTALHGQAPTYRLWQSYTIGDPMDATLVYSLEDWLDISKQIKHVDPVLRTEMSHEVFWSIFSIYL